MLGLDLFEYVAWLRREAPPAQAALAHPFAQALLQAEADDRPVGVMLNMVLDPWFQVQALPALALPKSLVLDAPRHALVARGIERFASGMALFYARLLKQFPNLPPEYHAYKECFATLKERFAEVFYEDGEPMPSAAEREADALASAMARGLAVAG